MEEQIAELINQVQSLAPELWRIAVRQAVAEGVQALIAAVSGLILIISGGFSWRTGASRYSDKDHNTPTVTFNDFLIMIGVSAIVVGTLITLFSGSSAFLHLYNPEWYALEKLLGLVR